MTLLAEPPVASTPPPVAPPETAPDPAPASAPVRTREMVIVNWSGELDRQYQIASPRDLLEACQALGVEFIPCQMSMDMFGLTREDLIDGMGDPAGAATAIEIMTGADASLFI